MRDKSREVEPTTMEDFYNIFLQWRIKWLESNPVPNFHPHEGNKKDSSGTTPRKRWEKKWNKDGATKQQQMLDEYPLLRKLSGKLTLLDK